MVMLIAKIFEATNISTIQTAHKNPQISFSQHTK